MDLQCNPIWYRCFSATRPQIFEISLIYLYGFDSESEV